MALITQASTHNRARRCGMQDNKPDLRRPMKFHMAAGACLWQVYLTSDCMLSNICLQNR